MVPQCFHGPCVFGAPFRFRLKLPREVWVEGCPKPLGVCLGALSLIVLGLHRGQRPESETGLLRPGEQPSLPVSFLSCHQIRPPSVSLTPLEAMGWLYPLAQEGQVCCGTSGWAQVLCLLLPRGLGQVPLPPLPQFSHLENKANREAK